MLIKSPIITYSSSACVTILVFAIVIAYSQHRLFWIVQYLVVVEAVPGFFYVGDMEGGWTVFFIGLCRRVRVVHLWRE